MRYKRIGQVLKSGQLHRPFEIHSTSICKVPTHLKCATNASVRFQGEDSSACSMRRAALWQASSGGSISAAKRSFSICAGMNRTRQQTLSNGTELDQSCTA